MAVVLSHNPGSSLEDVVRALAAQTLTPARTIIVDNASTDGSTDTVERVAAEAGLEGLEVIALGENMGVGAGHTVGWKAALADPSCELVWSLEHDTCAEPECLERLVGTAHSRITAGERLGIVAARGERTVQEGAERDAAGAPTEPFPAPRVTFNGILVTRALVEAIGFPRADFFVGFEDWELHRRLTRAGFTAVEDPRALVLHRTKGDHRMGLRPSVLRSYYSTRNSVYLRVAVDGERWARLRSAAWALASVGRIVVRDDRRAARVCARVTATFDGVTGRLGHRHYWFLRPH
ncbi:MAG: glycosyltransferase [Acidimicrobiia bacterium]|nr:glycosyltransferase [Acidimicrobiia bacterium]